MGKVRGTEGSTRKLARRAWKHLFDFLMSSVGQRDAVLEGLGLTPNDAKALGSLLLERALPMNELARVLKTDASNATWVINRLEKRQLVVRKLDTQDRRLKLVLLTERGDETRRALLAAFYEPPPGLSALDPADLAELERIGEKLAGARDGSPS